MKKKPRDTITVLVRTDTAWRSAIIPQFEELLRKQGWNVSHVRTPAGDDLFDGVEA